MYDDIPTLTLPSGRDIPALGIGTWNMGESQPKRLRRWQASAKRSSSA